MKKLLLTLLLALAATAYAQQSAPPSTQVGSSAPPAAAAPQQKVIKDPAEYNAYIAAVQTQDPAPKAAALEAFLQSYPNSVMKEDANELLLKDYQQLLSTDPQKYTQKVMDTGQRLLQIDPNNLTALALLSYMDRALAQGGGSNAEQQLQQGRQYGERGLQQLQTQNKPAGYSDDQWNKLKQDFRLIFLGSVGHAALQSRDYPIAQQDLKEVVSSDPSNFTNVYLLALAYLEPTPLATDGLFWIARAIALMPPGTPPAQLQTIERYGRAKYVRYHGSDEGWDRTLALAKTTAMIPAGFTVAPAPSPAEQAALMLQKNPPEQMSFADWQFILSSGNQQAADQVWTAIKGKALKMVAQVVSATTTTVQFAGSEDDIQANKSDIELTLTTPLVTSKVPKPGIQVTFQGVPTSYDSNPFLVHMSEGMLEQSAPKPRRRTQ